MRRFMTAASDRRQPSLHRRLATALYREEIGVNPVFGGYVERIVSGGQQFHHLV
jgi:hypothetical protein